MKLYFHQLSKNFFFLFVKMPITSNYQPELGLKCAYLIQIVSCDAPQIIFFVSDVTSFLSLLEQHLMSSDLPTFIRFASERRILTSKYLQIVSVANSPILTHPLETPPLSPFHLTIVMFHLDSFYF